MNISRLMCVIAILGLATASLAAGPAANPGQIDKAMRPAAPAIQDKAFGDPTDLLAAANAAADYIRTMQADFTEDNAGNGFSDVDPDDAGWDWVLAPFEHSASASSHNLYGVIANSIFDVYDLTGDAGLRTVLDDVAAELLVSSPADIHYAGDMMFLLRYAELSGVATPADYQNLAAAIWTWRLTNTGDGIAAASVAEGIRDSRHSQGYDNGIIGWDVGVYAEALIMLDAAFPGNGYGADAAAVAEVMYQDSFAGLPGYFDVFGTSQGYDPTYTNKDYWWYALGVSGLIQAFTVTNTHTTEIPALEAALLACQYPDGAFSDQYGTPTDVNTRDWQSTAYATLAMSKYLTGLEAETYAAGTWLGATQDGSGGFVYSSGNHYPEIGAEAAAALAAAYTAGAASVDISSTFNNPSQCGLVADISFDYDRSAGTPGLFGYEFVIQISGPVTLPLEVDFTQVAAMDYFRVDDNGGGNYTINSTRFGADPGLLIDAELFYIDNLTTTGDGTVTVDVLSYRMRDSQNVPIFVDQNGLTFGVDCTAPAAVTDITATPRHNKVDVSWTHDGIDTITYEIYRGLWYNGPVTTSAYPEYDDVSLTTPTRPSSRAVAISSGEWVLAGTVAAGTTTFTDLFADETFRGVYYYEVFAVDAAINASPPAAANDRSLNYWLGDVYEDPLATPTPITVDGYVDNQDITTLGAAFATTPIDAAYNNVCDVGPTDDASGTGIPETDNIIDFEDLIIFALNYGVVGPAKSAVPASGVIDLAWTQREDGRWALHLVNGSGLKGVHLQANLPVGSIAAGELLDAQSDQSFVLNAGTRLDANVALLGRNAAIEGTGELLIVNAPQDIQATDLVIDLRSIDNTKLEYTLDKVSGSNLPTAFTLNANYPNPFNPMTKISFSLPEAQDVELAVYSLDGRRVATLLNETRGPGQHDVVWTGRDDSGRTVASGIYMYRINAGPYSQVRKMTLMK